MHNSNPNVVIEDTTTTLLHKAMVIDDAFDKDILDDEIRFDEFMAFYHQSNEDGSVDQLLQKHGVKFPDLTGAGDTTPSYIAFMHELWYLRSKQEDAEEILNPLFHSKLQNLEDLMNICENLSQQGFEVVVKDSKTTDFNEVRNEENHFKIILIDYNLGRAGEEAVANARKKAHDIYEACPEGKKPLMILMSTFANARNEVDAFRKGSNLGNVIFRFAPKEKLLEQSTASLLVQIYKNESEHVHKLQKYVSSLHMAAVNAMKKFKEDIDALTIDDYTFIHQTTADDQSHPFGDYLGWLYGAHWSNLLLKDFALKKEKDELDRLVVHKPLPYNGMPSDTVVEIYMNALFEPETGEIGDKHSLAGKSVNDGKDIIAEVPHLHLGDIFSHPNSTDLFMVINPQCDLERPIDKNGNHSILLIPGQLHSFDEPNNIKSSKTELIIHDGKRHRVIWKLKEVISIPLTEFIEWKVKNKLERTLRLRLPFALELQHEFTSMMSRVGLPVSPPFAKEVNIQVYFQTGGQMEKILNARTHYGFLAIWRKADKRIRLTIDFAMDLKKAVLEKREELVANQQPELGRGGNPIPDVATNTVIKKIDSFLTQFDEWFLTTPYFDLPNSEGKTYIIKDLMKCILDYAPSEKDLKTLVLIDIVTNVSDGA